MKPSNVDVGVDLDYFDVMKERYKSRIWTNVNGVPYKVTDLSDPFLEDIIKRLQKDPDQVINNYLAKHWLPMMLAEYDVRLNNKAISATKIIPVDGVVPLLASFPTKWTQLEPIMIRPSYREYHDPALVEYSETIYEKYHCVVELDLSGYRVGYVGVRSNHPAYRQELSIIKTSVDGGISYTTHQVATFKSPYISMWYFAIYFNREEDYPDVYALDKYKEYWEGTPAYYAVEETVMKNNNAPGTLKGKGFFKLKDLDYVKQQLVQLVLDLEQFEKIINI